MPLPLIRAQLIMLEGLLVLKGLLYWAATVFTDAFERVS
jgi:hypothetical protein